MIKTVGAYAPTVIFIEFNAIYGYRIEKCAILLKIKKIFV